MEHSHLFFIHFAPALGYQFSQHIMTRALDIIYQKSATSTQAALFSNLPRKMMLLFLLVIISSGSHAYRIGDAVGILIRTTSTGISSSSVTNMIEAYRHQLPRFGISTRTSFDIRTLIRGPDYLHAATTTTTMTMEEDANTNNKQEQEPQQQHLRFSISFDDGFHHIPWVDIYNNNNNNNSNKKYRVLESLLVTIIYSSGDGMIHAVHRTVKYTTTTTTVPKKFHVEYIWINEADVDIQDGILTMCVCVLVMSLFGMIEAFRAGTTTSSMTTLSSSSSSYMDNDRENDGATRWGGGRNTTNKYALHEA